MKNHLNTSKTVALAIWLAVLLVPALEARADHRTQETEVPASGIQSIMLQAGNGSARIMTGTDDRIRVLVEVSPKRWTDEKPFRSIRSWFLTSSYEDITDLLDAIRIDTVTGQEGELRIGLIPTGGGRKDRVSEKWTVIVPARMALALRMDYAEVEISGIAGGADVRAGAGSVQVDVPGGDLRVELSVGDVEVKSASGSVGEVDLESTVGSTRLWLNGMRVKYPNPPGPGSRVSASGRGDDIVRVDVQVGDISVDVSGEGKS